MREGMKRYAEILRSLTLVIGGSFIFAAAINAFTIANHLGEGGVTGITLFLYYTLGWSTAVTNFVINSFLMVIGYRFLERKTILYTLLSIATMSLFLDLTKMWSLPMESPLVAAIASGVAIGLSIGLVILGNGTTAGSDIVAMICKKYFGMNIAATLLTIDVLVVTPLSFVIGIENAVITLAMLYIASRVMNFVLEGFNPRKSVMIISQKHKEISEALTKSVDRGITILSGKGYYSNEDKQILYIVINRLQLLPVERIVQEIDPKAFVIITEVQQVLGEGFTFRLDKPKG